MILIKQMKKTNIFENVIDSDVMNKAYLEKGKKY